MYPGAPNAFLWALVCICLAWFVGITFLVWKDRIFLKKMLPNRAGNLKDKLEIIVTELQVLEKLKKESLDYIQKFALKRYNPYHDTGGDQSFSAVWLNGKGDGLVITSLHSRAGTRFFAKPVKAGKEEKFKFSEEEEQIIKEAMSN